MTTATSDYLARLDRALRDVPHGIAAEIRSGIAEELSSLDPHAAEQRIRQLGDPAVIAREAMDAAGDAPPVPQVIVTSAAPVAVSTTSTRGFAIVAALALGFGGYLVPFVGWVVGAVLVVMSSMWRRWEKVVAIAAPVVFFAVSQLFAMVAWAASDGLSTDRDAVNPLAPNLFSGPHMFIILVVVLLIPASGLWLLWRMRGRTPA